LGEATNAQPAATHTLINVPWQVSADIVFKGCGRRRKSPDSDPTRDTAQTAVASLPRNQTSTSLEPERGRSPRPQQQTRRSHDQKDYDTQPENDNERLEAHASAHANHASEAHQPALPDTLTEIKGHHMVLLLQFICVFVCLRTRYARAGTHSPRARAS
jgi:hypothetical protein